MLTKILYNGVEINPSDILVVWSDHMGHILTGEIDDYASSRADDAVDEALAGAGF